MQESLILLLYLDGNAPSDVDANNVDHTPVVALHGGDVVHNNVTITPHKEVTVPLPDHKSVLIRPIWTVPPAGSKLPSLENFRLTEYMIKSRAEGNVIIITFGNYAFMDFIINWVKHLTDLNIFNLLVGKCFISVCSYLIDVFIVFCICLISMTQVLSFCRCNGS